MAKKGVGSAGLVDLQATLYRAQEQARLVRAGVLDPADTSGRRKAGIDVSAFVKRNAGVEARDQRDKAQLQTPDSRLESSRSALERKVLVYERLAAGNACDGDDEDLYNVDFVRKEAPREGLQQVSHAAFEYDYGGGGGGAQDGGRAGTVADWREPDVGGGDAARERRRRDWEAGEQSKLAAELAEEDARRERAQAAEEAEAATAAGRQRAAAAKERAEAAAVRKREQLKMGFLKRQLATAKAAKKPPPKPA